MTREQRIVETFVELVRAVLDDYDVDDVLHGLMERCVELLTCAEAGLMIADSTGALRVVASSSERAGALETLQIQGREGPCFDCYSHGKPVSCEDLTAALDRWPSFAPIGVAKGFRAVQAFPMRVGGRSVGSLNLFRIAAGSLDEEDMALGQGMADTAAITLLQERRLQESDRAANELQGALSSRVVIEQAKGVLAERSKVDVDDAFASLRAYARANNTRLLEVARDLVDGRLDATRVANVAPTASPSEG